MQKENNAFELRWHSKYVFGCISFKSTKLVKSKKCMKKHQRNPKCMSYQNYKRTNAKVTRKKQQRGQESSLRYRLV